MSDLLKDNGHTCSGLTSKFHHFELLTCTYDLRDGVKQEESVRVCVRVCVLLCPQRMSSLEVSSRNFGPQQYHEM